MVAHPGGVIVTPGTHFCFPRVCPLLWIPRRPPMVRPAVRRRSPPPSSKGAGPGVRKCTSGVAIGGRGEAKTPHFQAFRGRIGVDTGPPPAGSPSPRAWAAGVPRKERDRMVGSPWPGRSPARPFCSLISGFPRMLHRFGNTPDAMDVVNNDGQVAAADPHHLPTPWPWPTRWAGVGTSCRQGREGHRMSVPHYYECRAERTPRP